MFSVSPASTRPGLGGDDLRQADPEVIVFMPCGFGLERCRADALRIAESPDWSALRASKTGCVFVTDGNSYFNRPEPRLAESLKIPMEILHPDTFAFGHDVARGDDGWALLAR